jgi:hypothetical protein
MENSENNMELIQALIACANECENAVSACSREKEQRRLKKCMDLNKDCAEICRQAAKLLERNSKITGSFLRVSSRICKLSADQNQKIDLPECMLACEHAMRCLDLVRIKQGRFLKIAVG